MITQLLPPRLVEALGFTLLHALWQGALFALALAVLLVTLKRYSPQARYLVSVGLLAAFSLASVVTFGRLYASSQAGPTIEFATASTVIDDESVTGSDADIGVATLAVETAFAKTDTPADTFVGRFGDYYQRHLPLLVTLWLIGVLVMQLRWLGQLAYVQRLKHYGNEFLPGAWRERLVELEAKLRIRKTVAYALSPRIDSPMVIGWLKPVVLLPREMFARLADTEIYAVLAHELAHVRRDDFAVNLLQSILTNVFFFHPGVWWMSSRADEEREQACDDLAVAALGGAIPYAKTLINVSELSLKPAGYAQPSLAMALQGKQQRRKANGFAARVKRLFGTQSGTGSFKEGFATACILFGALFVAGFASSKTGGDSLSSDTGSNYVAGFGESENFMDSLPDEQGGERYDSWSEDQHIDMDMDMDMNGPTIPRQVIDPTSDEAIRRTMVDALNATIFNGNFDEFNELLELVENVDVRDSRGYSPLSAATHANQVEMARILLAHGAKVDGRSQEGWTALAEAADEGAIEVASLLIKAGANVNAVHPRSGFSALAAAADNNYIKIVELLVQNGADVNGFGGSRTRSNPSQRPPLHAAANEGNTNVMRYLLDKGADINLRDAQGRTALMYAASEGQGDAVALLMSRRADPNIEDESDRRAKDYATAEGNDELARMLSIITKPAASRAYEQSSPMTSSANQTSLINDALYDALFKAVDDGDLITIDAILKQRDIDVDHTGNNGLTPLMVAASEGQLKALNLLLVLGAKPNLKTPDGWTALLFAASEHHADITRALLKAGANPNATIDYKTNKIRNGETTSASSFGRANALLVATEEEAIEVVKVLLESGANPNQSMSRRRWTRDANRLRTDSSSDGWTPYLEAVHTSNAALIKLFEQHGANPNTQTSDGQTPKTVAAAKRAVKQ